MQTVGPTPAMNISNMVGELRGTHKHGLFIINDKGPRIRVPSVIAFESTCRTARGTARSPPLRAVARSEA